MRLRGFCGCGMNTVFFEKVSCGGCVLRNASALIAERGVLRKGYEHLTVSFPTEVSSFDFQVENSGRTVQYKLNAQSLRFFGLHISVSDAHRAGAHRHQNKQCDKRLNRLISYIHHTCEYRQYCHVGNTSNNAD